MTVPVGTILNARLVEGLSTERNHVGDTFSATLDQPLMVDSFVIAERGSRLQGKIVDVKESGRVKGLAEIGISLTQLHTSDGQNIAILTDTFTKAAASSVKQDVERGAVATGIGAVIGAIAGGGKGAAIGAGVGAAAGVGGAVATRGKPATLATRNAPAIPPERACHHHGKAALTGRRGVVQFLQYRRSLHAYPPRVFSYRRGFARKLDRLRNALAAAAPVEDSYWPW